MKMVIKTGLVPVHSLKTGEIFGVKPAIARAMLSAKEAILVDIPDDIPSITVADLPKQKTAPDPVDEPMVEIPEDWESIHFLQQIKLAKSLQPNSPPPDGVKPLEHARTIIADEVQRRAALQDAGKSQ